MSSTQPRRAPRKAPLWLYPSSLIAITILLLVLINTVLYLSPPSWLGDPVNYALVQRSIASLVVVFIAQAFATLVLGMSAGVFSSEIPRGASVGEGTPLSSRTLVSRLKGSLWLVIFLRALGLLVIFFASVNLLTNLSGLQSRSAFTVPAFFVEQPILLAGASFVFLAFVLLEPWMFARVSALLGLLFGANATDDARPIASAAGPVASVVVYLLACLILGVVGGGIWELLVDPPAFIRGGVPFLSAGRDLIPVSGAAVINRILLAAGAGAFALLAEGILLALLPGLAMKRLAAYQQPVNRWQSASSGVDKTPGLG